MRTPSGYEILGRTNISQSNCGKLNWATMKSAIVDYCASTPERRGFPWRFNVLTSEEVKALDAILDDALVKSKEEDDGDPVFHEVEANGVDPFADRRTQDRVYTSLAKKGLIQCSGDEDETLEYVCITPEGLEALKTAKGVN